MKQCRKCPWKKSTNPYEIPNGYSVEQHEALRETISKPGEVLVGRPVFSCHEHDSTDRVPCVGWLHNQLGPGNNIALRLAVATGKIAADYELDGDQHASFEETLP